MLACNSCYICESWKSKEVGGGFFKVIVPREGEKPQTRETFVGRHKKTTQGVNH